VPPVISNNLVLAQTPALNANNPLIGWRNIVTVSGIVADTEDVAFPAANLANPATHLFWRGANTNDQNITISVGQIDPIDYLAVAGHNFGSGALAVKLQGRSSLLDPFTDLTQDVIPADDSPLLFRFVPTSLVEIRLAMAPDVIIPQAAVIYVGNLLVLQRRIYVGHRVLPFNRQANIVTGRSEEGQFLGRIVLGQMTGSALELNNITPDFYREEMEPWLKRAVEAPFFFAWRPSDYPAETGYCWASGDAQMSNQRSNGMVQVALNLQGIVA
jgi:hypothetical protein